ncbi:MAG: hypothetical protein EOP52_03820 [Sphingobacteriales bacterium]|nr:MAG: hypothetical protein EOP52_03820 [Sphingobacteriales bacterium]
MCDCRASGVQYPWRAGPLRRLRMAGLTVSGTEVSCPRCGTLFQCRPDQITVCGCFGISFTDAQQEHIRRQYTGCLCRRCLIDLRQTLPESDETRQP